MFSQKRKAFTLVELIIVITILAILRTIGFMSFQSYTTDARDGKRKTDLGEIRKGLEIYQLKNQILPKPDEQILTVKTGSTILSYQGYLGTTVQKTIRATSDIKDTKDNTYYTYTTNGTQTKYQLLAMLENNPIALNIRNRENLINQTYAITDYSNRYTYTLGSKIGVFLTGSTNAPLQETLTGVDLSSNTNTYKVIFSNTTNSGTISSSGTSLYIEIINNQGTGGTTIQTNSCTTQPSYTNAIFTIGTPITINQAWQGTTSTGACYYTCGAGKVLVGNDCVSENCSGTTPDGIAKVSNALTFAGGTWNYNTNGGLCTYSCGTGYHTEDSGLNCISNTKSCAITNGVGTQTWNTGTSSWGTCIISSCNTNYTNISGSCFINEYLQDGRGDSLGNGNLQYGTITCNTGYQVIFKIGETCVINNDWRGIIQNTSGLCSYNGISGTCQNGIKNPSCAYRCNLIK
ncbi:MAG: type II secretion system protein [Candidatus Gracilibacteria bacterium]|nr:type II secretion system protein [Candidatus Gracilibacteria bacterium]